MHLPINIHGVATLDPYETPREPTLADARIARALRGDAMDAEELRCLQAIVNGHRQPGAPDGCLLALSARGYASHTSADGWRATQQGEWFLARIGQYAAPLHEIDRNIREAGDGCTRLIRGAETPTDAVDAMAEARELLEQAAVRIRAALEVVNRPVMAEAAE